MAWTAPRDWTVGEVVTASHLNTQVRDNLLAIPHPLHYEPATLDIVSTATEQTFLSYTIPANSMGANGYVHTELIGDLLTNNPATAGTFTAKVKIGGTDRISWTAEYGDEANRRTFRMNVFFINRGSTSSQILRAEPGATPATVGSFASQTVETTIDTTAAQDVAFTFDWVVADAQNSFRRLWARTLTAKQ